ncbi:MAG: hypothetical protein HRT35_35395, partial [Algicola sp.]|nr:hypothetical protein [Algicola sp.]
TLDLAALGCTIGEPCTISIDTQDLDANATIEWRLTADIQEDGEWVNSELANEQTLVNLDLLQLDDFKTDTYYAPVTVTAFDPVLHDDYENFRLKYAYKKHITFSKFEQFEEPLTGQAQRFDIDLSHISKETDGYEDSAKLFVQIIADKKAKEGSAAVNDVILESREIIYNTLPSVKLREAYSTDGILKFSALIPGWLKNTEILTVPKTGNYKYNPYDSVAGPERVDYEINYFGNEDGGGTTFIPKGGYYPNGFWTGDHLKAVVHTNTAPELTLTATNSDVFANQNGTLATASWTVMTLTTSHLALYCPVTECTIKLQYRMLDELGVATQWKSYLLDDRHETEIGTTAKESLWFEDIKSGVVEVKLVAQYTLVGATELTTSTIVEKSVVVAPSTTFIPPDNMQLPDNPTQWLYSINGQTSTDTQYDVSMKWPVADDDTFSLAQFIDDSWQLLYNGSVNGWSGTMSNLTQAADVKLKLTSCQGAICHETLKDIYVNSDVTFTAVTAETSDVFEFSWLIEQAEADFVRIFYTEDEALFDTSVDQGWQELSYGTGMVDKIADDPDSHGKGYLRHSPNVMKAAFRVFACANSGYCFTPPKTNIVHFPLAPVWGNYIGKYTTLFVPYTKAYRDGDYRYKHHVNNLTNDSSAVYSELDGPYRSIPLSDFDLTHGHDVFSVTTFARKVDMSLSYGDPSSTHKNIVYVSGDTAVPTADITSAPGCHQSNVGCGAALVDPFNPGVVTGIFSHPNGIQSANVYIENTVNGAKRKLSSDIVKSDTVWHFTANIANTGVLEGDRGYKITIEGTSGTNSTVVSDYYYVEGDSSLVPGPTSISLTGDASAIVFSWNADAEQKQTFIGYDDTFGNSLRNYNSYTLHNPDNSGSFGVKACYYFDDITGSNVHKCTSYIYVDYSLENGSAVCGGAACNQPEPEPEQEPEPE